MYMDKQSFIFYFYFFNVLVDILDMYIMKSYFLQNFISIDLFSDILLKMYIDRLDFFLN